jgi:imidazolonepropionase-like amidohydrolase
VVKEAHKKGKPAFAHPSNMEGLEVAINSGVDVLAHTAPMSGDWNADFTQKLKSHHMALIPTMTLFEVEDKKFGASAEEDAETMALARQELGAYVKAGGEILFGTDAGYIEEYDTAEEFRQMAQAGMGWQQILASLTTNPAQRFKYATRAGTIARDKDADLVVLDADPAQDVTAFSNVHYTIRAGKVIYSKSSK